jgi:hypothetical protein
MTNREKELLLKKASKLQRDIDRLIARRNELMREANKTEERKAKKDCWKTAEFIELEIEKLNRKLRGTHLKLNPPAREKMLWEFSSKEVNR